MNTYCNTGCMFYLSGNCVLYKGPDLPITKIKNGDDYTTIIQKIETSIGGTGLQEVFHDDTNTVQLLGKGTPDDPLIANFVGTIPPQLTLYNGDGTIVSNRVVTLNGNILFQGTTQIITNQLISGNNSAIFRLNANTPTAQLFTSTSIGGVGTSIGIESTSPYLNLYKNVGGTQTNILRVDANDNSIALPLITNAPSLITNSEGKIVAGPSIITPVNADWNSTSGLSEILNKPTIPDAQIQSDWNQSNTIALDYIKNKPTLFPANTLYSSDGNINQQRSVAVAQDILLNFSGDRIISGGRDATNVFRFNDIIDPISLRSNTGQTGTVLRMNPDIIRMEMTDNQGTNMNFGGSFVAASGSTNMSAETGSGTPDRDILEFLVDANNHQYVYRKGASDVRAILFESGRFQGAPGINSNDFATLSQLNWISSGANIYNSNTGNVGIGTNTPTQKLEVAGTIYANAPTSTAFIAKSSEGLRITDNNGSINFYNSANDARSAYIQGNAYTGVGLLIGTDGPAPISFTNNNVSSLYISGFGNVGINNQSPNPLTKLHTKGAVLNEGQLSVQGAVSAVINGALTFYTGTGNTNGNILWRTSTGTNGGNINFADDSSITFNAGGGVNFNSPIKASSGIRMVSTGVSPLVGTANFTTGATSVNVSTQAITANSIIILSVESFSGSTASNLSSPFIVSKTTSSGFTIGWSLSSTQSGSVSWMIIEPF